MWAGHSVSMDWSSEILIPGNFCSAHLMVHSIVVAEGQGPERNNSLSSGNGSGENASNTRINCRKCTSAERCPGSCGIFLTNRIIALRSKASPTCPFRNTGAPYINHASQVCLQRLFSLLPLLLVCPSSQSNGHEFYRRSALVFTTLFNFCHPILALAGLWDLVLFVFWPLSPFTLKSDDSSSYLLLVYCGTY